jgi:hypothetical protein
MLGGFQEVEFDFGADNPGLSLFHCHQMLHMDFGFVQLIEYQSPRSMLGGPKRETTYPTKCGQRVSFRHALGSRNVINCNFVNNQPASASNA